MNLRGTKIFQSPAIIAILVAISCAILLLQALNSIRDHRSSWEREIFRLVSAGDEQKIKPLIRPVGFFHKIFPQDGYPILATYLCKFSANEPGSNIRFVEYLLNRNVSVHSGDAQGKSPIHCAYTVPMIALLLKHGANINATNPLNGWTLLHYLAERSSDDSLVAYVTLAGAEPNIQSRDDARTPLHNAAYYGRDNVVRVLMRAGANRGLRTVSGAKPLDWAVGQGHMSTVVILRRWAR